jgi:hypothetical protein
MKKKLDQWQIFVTNTAEAGGGGRKGSLIGRALLILVFYV